MMRHLDKLVLFAGIAAIILIAVISLVPGSERPHTGAPGQGEHFVAYLMTAFIVTLRQRDWRQRLILIILLSGYAGVLELLQIYVPGRNAQLIDFVSSVMGTAGGAILGLTLSPLYRRWLMGKPAR